MPDIAAALKAEIARVARKGTKADIESLKKPLAQQHRALAELRARADQVERLLRKTRSSAAS
jgi:cell division protein FtsB